MCIQDFALSPHIGTQSRLQDGFSKFLASLPNPGSLSSWPSERSLSCLQDVLYRWLRLRYPEYHLPSKIYYHPDLDYVSEEISG